MKLKRTISLDTDTDARLKQYADLRHTNVSQLITDWIWQVDIPREKAVLPKHHNQQKKTK